MSDFHLIECGYNLADETINFGSRSLADGDNLHEACTLATLKCSESDEETPDPHINTIIRDGCIYFSVNTSLRIFSNKECSKIIFAAAFEATVDTFCVCPRGNYVLVCLRNGIVNLIDCSQDNRSVCSQSCEKTNNIEGQYFIGSFFDSDCFLIVSRTGHVYRLIHQNEIKIERIHDFNFHIEVTSLLYPFLLVNGSKLASFDLESGYEICEDIYCRLKKIFPLEQMFFGLDFDGKLYRICPRSLLVFLVDNDTVYGDALLISDTNKKQVIVLKEDKERQQYIELLTYPDFSTIYLMKISEPVHMMAPESINDETIYVSKISANDVVIELRIRMVYETDPEQRLGRLLKKQMYAEAECFAQLHGLDRTVVSKAKAEAIVEKSSCTFEEITNLFTLLDTIEDVEFKLKCCLNIDIANNLDDVLRILSYGCKLTPKPQYEELQKILVKMMFRFDTFARIHHGSNVLMQSWSHFVQCDLKEEIKSLLRSHHVEEAKILYSRLDLESMKMFDETDISDILSILNNVGTDMYQSFLPVFLPLTLQILPSTFPLFVKWTYSKVLCLERRAKQGFPENAIEFTEGIVRFMRVKDLDSILLQREYVLHRGTLAEMSTLLSSLKTLKTLKQQYGRSIPVASFMSGPHDVVRHLLNVNLSSGDYEVFLESFVLRFITDNRLEPNEIFLAEIVSLMQYGDQYWMGTIESILNCISSIDLRLEAVRNVLKQCPTPWCEPVRKIASDALKYSHPLVAEIKELIEHEPIEVVLRRPKYKIKEKRIHNIDDLKFFVGRIIYCNEPTMVEDVLTLCTNEESKCVGNMKLIHHFIKADLPEKALELLDRNPPKERHIYAKELSIFIETIVNSDGVSVSLKDKYAKAAYAIFKRLSDSESNDFTVTCNQDTLSFINTTHQIRQSFRTSVTSYDLRRCSGKNAVVDDVVKQTRESFESGDAKLDEVFSRCRELAAVLRVREDDLLVQFCDNATDHGVIFKTAQRVLDVEASPKNLCVIVMLLLKQTGTYKAELCDSTSSELDGSLIVSEQNSVVELDAFQKSFQLAAVLVAKAVYKASPDEFACCMDVANWVGSSFYFTRKSDGDVMRAVFGDKYDYGSVPPGFSTFSTIRTVFDAFCQFVGQFYNPNTKYLTYGHCGEDLKEEEFFRELETLPYALESLCREGQEFTAYNIVAVLQQALLQLPKQSENQLKFAGDLLKFKCIPKLLVAVVNKSNVDTALLYNLLLAWGREDSLDFILVNIRKFRRQPKKFECIIRTGLRLWDHYSVTIGRSEIMNALITIKWWKKFEGKKLHYDVFFKTKPKDRAELLINSGCMDTELADEYCQDYNIDKVEFHKLLLRGVFLNWKPEYEIHEDDTSRRLVMKNGEEDLVNGCRQIMEVVDQQDVVLILNSVENCVNLYYYEVFAAMFAILAEISPHQGLLTQKREMLLFLQHYQRVRKPSDTETEQWFTMFPDTQCLDVLSEFRLPFSPSLFNKQPFNIIRPEINLKTYKVWFGASRILEPHLKKDDICCFVIKDVVASGVLGQGTRDGWMLHRKHEYLMAEIDECVKNIGDLERTCAVTYYLMGHTANGADQVNAAGLCYKYAVEYKKVNQGSSLVEQAVTKAEKKYLTHSAFHILHVYGLVEKKYVDMVPKVNKLITTLYLDERIVRDRVRCPDINRATEELAALLNLDIKQIRTSLVNQWLCNSVSLDATLESPSMHVEESRDDDGSLHRAAYICGGVDVEQWRIKLLEIGMGSETTRQWSLRSKPRALKVFAMISDEDTIVQSTKSTYEEFVDFVDKLKLIGNLDQLGIQMDIETLAGPKKMLLNQLVQRAANPLAVRTMALICMTYKIHSIKYWEFIIDKTIMFCLFNKLKTYVNFLNHYKFHVKSFYINAWQKLIDDAFGTSDSLKNTQLHQMLVGAFVTVQSCPIAYSLKFDAAFRHCLEIGKTEFAAALLQYVEVARRDECVREILKSDKNLEGKLKRLAQDGVWGIPQVIAILSGKD